MMIKPCIFCNIIKNKSNIIYEDKTTVAFMDIKPITVGHILVTPKDHFSNFIDTPNELVGNVNMTVHKIAIKLLTIIPTIKGFNILTNNNEIAYQTVMHYHVHIIPKYEHDKGLIIDTTKENAKIKDINNILVSLQSKLN